MKMAWVAGFAFSSFLSIAGHAQNPSEALLALSKGNHTLAIVDPASLKVLARVPVGDDPHEVITSADGKTAYVSNYGFGALNSATGALTSLPLNPAISVANLSGVYAEPSGKYLYVARTQTGGGALFAYSIQNDGNLTTVSPVPVATPDVVSSMEFSADIR
jgi:DNA-binding beta-propeller fold protein YncE